MTRFANCKKLVSYIGLNPSVLESGKSAGRRSISRHGRRDLKALMVQAAQCVLRRGDDDMAKWARRKIASGKNRNVVVCAVARKLVARARHILMGHPVPDRESERSFRLKLAKLAAAVGRNRLAALGYKKPCDYIEAVCAQIYPPEAPVQSETPAPPPCAPEDDRQATSAPALGSCDASVRRPGPPRDAKGALKKQPARVPGPSIKTSRNPLPRKGLNKTAKKGA